MKITSVNKNMVILFVFSVVAAIINVCFQNFSSANAQGVTTESGSISAKEIVRRFGGIHKKGAHCLSNLCVICNA